MIEELIKQKEALEKQIQEAQRAARGDALAKIKELMTTNGLTVADIAGKAAPSAEEIKVAAKKVADKYRHPETGESWTGRGLKPKWVTAHIEAGGSLEELMIEKP